MIITSLHVNIYPYTITGLLYSLKSITCVDLMAQLAVLNGTKIIGVKNMLNSILCSWTKR